MQKLKYALSAIAASLALALGTAVPVGATENHRLPANLDCVDNSCNTQTNNDNDSKTITLGDCSIYGDVNQNSNQSNSSDVDADGGEGGDGEEGDNNTGGAGGAGGSSSQSNTASNTITLTCTTNNVTQASSGQVLAAQTEAPKGGVSAGAGGAVASSVGSIFGLLGSAVTAGAGLVARRKWNV